MSIPLNNEEIDKLNAKLLRVCDELHELGASAVLVMISFEEKTDDGVVGHNRGFRRDGNFFETLGLLDHVRESLHRECLKD